MTSVRLDGIYGLNLKLAPDALSGLIIRPNNKF